MPGTSTVPGMLSALNMDEEAREADPRELLLPPKEEAFEALALLATLDTSAFVDSTRRRCAGL